MQLLSVILAMIVFLPVAAPASFLTGTIWEKAAGAQGVDPALLYAVTVVESARRVAPDRVKPWPYALNVNGYNLSLYPQSKQEAENILEWLLSQGIVNVDVGLGQVNLRWHGHRVRQAADLLDPAVNLQVAAQILSESLAASSDPVLGVGRYHSGTSWRARRYGGRVLGLYQRLLAYSGAQPPRGAAAGVRTGPPPPMLPPMVTLKSIMPALPGITAPVWPEGRYEYKLAPVRRVGGKHGG